MWRYDKRRDYLESDDELGPVELPSYFDRDVREAELGHASSPLYMEDPRRGHGRHRESLLDYPMPNRPADYRNRWSPPPYRPGRFIDTPFGIAQRDTLGRLRYTGSHGPHTGKGPRGYNRPDDRIREDVIDRLTEHGEIDASDIDVQVQNGEATLTGMVADRFQKRAAEDVTWDVPGVREVRNVLEVESRAGKSQSRAA